MGASSRGMSLRNIADIIPNLRDICNTADIPKLGEIGKICSIEEGGRYENII